jgi:hypothetical protein
MEDIEKYRKAKERVAELKMFYVHLIIYGVVNLIMAFYNLIYNPGYYWFFWPLIGWGIGICTHALSVFLRGRMFGKSWEEKKIREIMEKEQS